jgi:hypothetical protein
VEFAPAMPGWRGYLGANQVDWILYNDLFLSNAGISIHGPNNPAPDLFHGQYYVQLQNSFPVATDVPALAQTGTLPSDAQTIQFLSSAPFAIGFTVTFASELIPLSLLGTTSNGRQIWGGDISAFAGQTGELRFRGSGTLDYIQFSPIPEPSSPCLFGLGAILFGFRSRGVRIEK